MATVIVILRFISMIKRDISLFVRILVFMSSLNFVLRLVEHEKSFVTSGPDEVADRLLTRSGDFVSVSG